MRAIDIIDKKRLGGEHSAEEINFLVRNYAQGGIPDYQMSAWLMAVVWRGLTPAETFALTGAMVATGDTLDLSRVDRPTLDKHSTGGVGDKTTLAVVPILAAGGVAVAKMSGRGLGHTGGTLDKLESIPGTRTALDVAEILRQVKDIGACLCAQTPALVPADQKMYALRDATSTVESLPLIASSIMSKKIAGGGRSIVLDVKVGAGAFMKTVDDARALARLMVDIGKANGRRVVAVLTDMNVPLGFNVGNSVEIREVAALLRGYAGVDRRLRELVEYLSGVGFHLAGVAASVDEGRALASAKIESGEAFETLCRIIEAQGGDSEYLRRTVKQPGARVKVDVRAPKAGFVKNIDASAIGLAAMRLGAGRETKDAIVDYAAGIVLRHTVCDRIERDAVIATLLTSTDVAARQVAPEVLAAFDIVDEPVDPAPLIYETIGE